MFLVIVVEMAQITPPVGFNLFVIQGMTGERIGRIARATLPFFLIIVGLALLITFVPEVVTFLPDTIRLGNSRARAIVRMASGAHFLPPRSILWAFSLSSASRACCCSDVCAYLDRN